MLTARGLTRSLHLADRHVEVDIPDAVLTSKIAHIRERIGKLVVDSSSLAGRVTIAISWELSLKCKRGRV